MLDAVLSFVFMCVYCTVKELILLDFGRVVSKQLNVAFPIRQSAGDAEKENYT